MLLPSFLAFPVPPKFPTHPWEPTSQWHRLRPCRSLEIQVNVLNLSSLPAMSFSKQSQSASEAIHPIQQLASATPIYIFHFATAFPHPLPPNLFNTLRCLGKNQAKRSQTLCNSFYKMFPIFGFYTSFTGGSFGKSLRENFMMKFKRLCVSKYYILI